MALRKFKPVTAGTRWRIGNAYAEVTTNVPEKTLVEAKPRTGGRNSSGHLSMRYRGGGHKQKIRNVDFKRNKHGMDASVHRRGPDRLPGADCARQCDPGHRRTEHAADFRLGVRAGGLEPRRAVARCGDHR